MSYFIDKLLVFLSSKVAMAQIRANKKFITLGPASSIYKETRIHNFPKQRDRIVTGKNCHIRGELLIFNYGGKIAMGDNTFVGEGTKIWSGDKITIGSNVLISHNCNIIDSNTHETDHEERARGFIALISEGQPKSKGSIKTLPITIEDNVWINFNVTILKGVTIGRGCIIGANAVITKDIPPFSTVIPVNENKIEILPGAKK